VIRGRAKRRRAAEATDALPDIPDAFDAAVAIDVAATPVTEPEADEVEADLPVDVDEPDEIEADQPKRLRRRLGRSRGPFKKMRGRMRARRIDDDVWDDLEETLLLADAGLDMTARLVDAVRTRAAAEGVGDADALPGLLEREIDESLQATAADRSLTLRPGQPNVWLLVGVNGAGKTTTAAKLATKVIDDGHTVLFAAADTFRAAAADQLVLWGDRLGVDVIRGQEGGDPGAIAFDAVQAAGARDIDLVLVDTAGRLHTKVNLMAELEKVRRVIERTPDALTEVLLVIDATTGQNGLAQARQFGQSIGVTGVVLTKLDGTPKGGIVLAIESDLGVPVKLIGVGEQADDLVPFEPASFAAALVGGNDDRDLDG
jgi:fused signal recognition particle receptor